MESSLTNRSSSREILLIDSDMYWQPRKLEAQVSWDPLVAMFVRDNATKYHENTFLYPLP